MDVRQGGDLDRELAYGNCKSAERYGRDVINKVIADIGNAGAVMFSVERAQDIPGGVCGSRVKISGSFTISRSASGLPRDLLLLSRPGQGWVQTPGRWRTG